MSAENTGAEAQPLRAAWRHWLEVAGAALLLLVVSEAIWLWETWPVRELLHPTIAAPARTVQPK